MNVGFTSASYILSLYINYSEMFREYVLKKLFYHHVPSDCETGTERLYETKTPISKEKV